MLKVLDLFSGIGGCSLGLEWVGCFETIAFCELDKKAGLVLNKHWPGLPIYPNIYDLTYERLQKDGITQIDVIVGGFPCQKVSTAGSGKGISEEPLWGEYARLIGEIRPQYAIIENVAALRYKGKGLYRVLADLAEIGYDAEWYCIPASAVGAPHQRDRIWIVAYPDQSSRCTQQKHQVQERPGQFDGDSRIGLDTGKVVAHSYTQRLPNRSRIQEPRPGWTAFKRGRCTQWQTEPEFCRVLDGFPGRVDRLKQLGNAVVPQILYLIGMALIEKHIGTLNIEKTS